MAKKLLLPVLWKAQTSQGECARLMAFRHSSLTRFCTTNRLLLLTYHKSLGRRANTACAIIVAHADVVYQDSVLEHATAGCTEASWVDPR
jgi:hypothetical protein